MDKDGVSIEYTNTEDNYATVTIPLSNETRFLIIAGRISLLDSTQVEEGSEVTEYHPFSYRIENLRVDVSEIDKLGEASEGNPLYGKTLLNFGDSIAAASTAGVDGYHEQIAIKNDMNLLNYAAGGATVTVFEGEGKHNIVEQVDRAVSNGLEPDYILLNGLTNDASIVYLADIGEVTTGYDEELNLNTFCGAFEYILKTLKKTYSIPHGTKIAYVRPHNMPTRDDRQVKLGELALEMCEKWSVPYVDIYKEGGLNTHIPEMIEPYTIDGDSGTHPNTLGYELFYTPLIESKMKSI